MIGIDFALNRVMILGIVKNGLCRYPTLGPFVAALLPGFIGSLCGGLRGSFIYADDFKATLAHATMLLVLYYVASYSAVVGMQAPAYCFP